MYPFLMALWAGFRADIGAFSASQKSLLNRLPGRRGTARVGRSEVRARFYGSPRRRPPAAARPPSSIAVVNT